MAVGALTLPYLAFHLVFQDTSFVRYALPLVPVVAFLAMRGVALASTAAVPVVAERPPAWRLGLLFGAAKQNLRIIDLPIRASFREGLSVLVEGDTRLFNQYGVIAVNPARHPHVKVTQAQQLIDWGISPPGQAAIAAYKVGGETLFFPNAKP